MARIPGKPPESRDLEAAAEEEARRREAPQPLEPQEEKKAEEEQSLDAKTTHEVIRRMAEKELERPASALFWSGLAAGLAMGLSMVVEGVLRSHLPDAPWRPLVAKLGYPVGFVVVIIASQQLFTENTLTPIVSLLHKRDGETLRKTAVLWGTVLLGNMLGTLLFAWFAADTETFKPEYRQAFVEVGRETFIGAFGLTFLRGIVAGWIIALMVWMLPAAEQSHLAVIVILAYIIGITGMAHVIAGSVEVFYLGFRGELGFGDALARFVAPTLLGNIVGGVGLVAALNHAQVHAGGSSSS
jgi:formate/nitrite transporter FocA (FNT family)